MSVATSEAWQSSWSQRVRSGEVKGYEAIRQLTQTLASTEPSNVYGSLKYLMIFNNLANWILSRNREFLLSKWEIWHTYSSYFMCRFPDLTASAESVIASGYAEFVTLSNGLSFWRSKDGFQRGINIVKLDTSGKVATFRLEVENKNELDITDYAVECVGISSSLRHSEIRLFRNKDPFFSPYLRAFLAPVRLIGEDYGLVNGYPIITLYENGVILVQIRIINPDRPVALEEFIDDYVNLPMVNFDYIDASPAIERLLPLVYELYTKRAPSFPERISTLRKISRHNRYVDDQKKKVSYGEFEFEQITLNIQDEEKTITSLSHTLFYITGYLCGIPKRPFEFAVFGTGNLPTLGHYWNGRPHVHISRHSRQAAKASKNEQMHRRSFSRILARVSGEHRANSLLDLPESTRPFEDYGVYINAAATLWVWSQSGLSSECNWIDSVYEHETQVGLLEYGHMLYRSLVEQSESISNRGNSFQMRKDLAHLEVYMAEISPYGELRDLLNNGWKAMGANRLKQQLQENLAVLETDLIVAESEQRERFQNFLTLIFGTLAVPTFAKEVISPLWTILGWWKPQGKNQAELFFIFIAVLLVVTLLWMFRRST